MIRALHPRRHLAEAAEGLTLVDEAHSPPPQPLRHGPDDRSCCSSTSRFCASGIPLPVQALRLRIFDAYQLIASRVANQRPVVIIDIDEESLKALGQWPWPRTMVADMVTRVT
jgi:hypothetical protein